MIASYFMAKFVDSYVAASQRKDLGLCVKCGGLNEGEGIACMEENCPKSAVALVDKSD
jgi:hypothetical protein